MPTADFDQYIASRIQAETQTLSTRWFDRLKDLLPVAATQVFPSQDLLDHIPELLREIGAYLGAPENEEIGANTSVIVKARELGLLRHRQSASVHQLLREYEILGRILQAFLAEELARMPVEPRARDCIAVTSRLQRAVHILMQTTVDTFVAEYTSTIAAQTRQLESFNRTVSHELRNPLGTLGYALVLLKTPEVLQSDAARARVLELAQRNCDRVRDLLNAITQLSRAGQSEDTPSVQRVEVTAIAGEVARQLRSMAEARGVSIRIQPDLPILTLDPARLELILMNLVSNAIKYADPGKPERYVEVVRDAIVEPHDRSWIVVRDNGLGIPAAARSGLFARFFRAHAGRDHELRNDGLGLGLSIVLECMKALGGEITVESTEGVGSAFKLAIPRIERPLADHAPDGEARD